MPTSKKKKNPPKKLKKNNKQPVFILTVFLLAALAIGLFVNKNKTQELQPVNTSSVDEIVEMLENSDKVEPTVDIKTTKQLSFTFSGDMKTFDINGYTMQIPVELEENESSTPELRRFGADVMVITVPEKREFQGGLRLGDKVTVPVLATEPPGVTTEVSIEYINNIEAKESYIPIYGYGCSATTPSRCYYYFIEIPVNDKSQRIYFSGERYGYRHEFERIVSTIERK